MAMVQTTMLSDQEILAIAENVLTQELGGLGYDHAEASSGPDDNEALAIYVRAVLKPGTPILGGQIFAKAYGALDNALMSRGEKRFPYFSLHHPDGDVPEPDDRGADMP